MRLCTVIVGMNFCVQHEKKKKKMLVLLCSFAIQYFEVFILLLISLFKPFFLLFDERNEKSNYKTTRKTKNNVCVLFFGSEIDFPKSSEAFVCFECNVPRVSWTYLMTGMEVGMKALPHATETYLRVNAEGILCIQHQACARFSVHFCCCIFIFLFLVKLSWFFILLYYFSTTKIKLYLLLCFHVIFFVLLFCFVCILPYLPGNRVNGERILCIQPQARARVRFTFLYTYILGTIF